MKNLKLIKNYYNTLNNKGKATFILGIIVIGYVILEAIS